MSRLLIPNTTQVPNVLLDRLMPALKSTSLRVVLAVVRFTYGFQKQADKISLTQLQRITGLSRQGVVDGVAALGSLLSIKPGAKGRGANEYSLNLDVSTGQLVNHFDQSTNLTSQKRSREVVNKVDSSKPIGSKPTKSGAKAPESSPIAKQRKLTRPDPAALAAFEPFYRAYPRHVGKADALDAWIELAPGPELVAEIMAGVERYTETVKDSEPKFIKHPGPWLNARRWEDEPAGGNGAGNGTAKPEFKDLGSGIVEADGLKMTRRDYERKYGARAS